LATGPHPTSSALDEREQVWVDDVTVRRTHAVRAAGGDFVQAIGLLSR